MSSQVSKEGLISHQLVGSLEDQKLTINPVNQIIDEGVLSIEKCEMNDIHRAKKSSPKKMSAFKRFFRWKTEVEPLTPTSDVPSSPIDRGSFKSENEIPSMIQTSSYSNFFGDASRNVLGPQGKPESPKTLDSPKRLPPDNFSSDEGADCETQSGRAAVAVNTTHDETTYATPSDAEIYLDNNIPKQHYKFTAEEDDGPLESAFASESAQETLMDVMESDEVLVDISVDRSAEIHVVADDCSEYDPDAYFEKPPLRRSTCNVVACVPDSIPDEIKNILSIAEMFSCETDAASYDYYPDVIKVEQTEHNWGEKCDGPGVLSTSLDIKSQVALENEMATAPSVACEPLPSSIALTFPHVDVRCPIAYPTEETQKKEVKEVVDDKSTLPQAHIDTKCAINNDKEFAGDVVQTGAPKRVDRHAFLSFGNLRFSTAHVPKIIPEEKLPSTMCIGRVINGISLAEVEARCKRRVIPPVCTINEAASFDDDSEGEGGESPRDAVEQNAGADLINNNDEEKDEAPVEEEVDPDISGVRQAEMLLASLRSARFAKRLDYLKVVDRLNQTKAAHTVPGDSTDNTGESQTLHAEDAPTIKESCDVEVTKTIYKPTTLVVPKIYNKPDSPSSSPGARPVKLVNVMAEAINTVNISTVDPTVEDACDAIDERIYESPNNTTESEIKVEVEVDVQPEVQKSSVSNFSLFARLFSPKTSICCTGAMSAGPCYSPFVESVSADGEKDLVTVTCETVGEEGYKSNSDGDELSGI